MRKLFSWFLMMGFLAVFFGAEAFAEEKEKEGFFRMFGKKADKEEDSEKRERRITEEGPEDLEDEEPFEAFSPEQIRPLHNLRQNMPQNPNASLSRPPLPIATHAQAPQTAAPSAQRAARYAPNTGTQQIPRNMNNAVQRPPSSTTAPQTRSPQNPNRRS